MGTQTKIPNIRLQARDIDIFDWVYKFRFLTAYQIAGLVEAVEEKTADPNYQFKGGQEAVLKRVARLQQAGYLNAITKVFHKHIYTLGPKAIDALVLERGIEREASQRVIEQKKRGDKHIAHSLLIAEFGATLALACKETDEVKLITWLPESNERQLELEIPASQLTDVIKKWQTGGELKLTKKPDAIFGLEDKQGKMFFVLEADRGTMTSDRFLKKMVTYYYFLAQDKFKQWSLDKFIHPEGKPIKNFRVITYTVTQQWQETLIKNSLLVNPEHSGSRMFWFTNQALVNPERPASIFEPIFSIAQISELNHTYSILE